MSSLQLPGKGVRVTVGEIHCIPSCPRKAQKTKKKIFFNLFSFFLQGQKRQDALAGEGSVAQEQRTQQMLKSI